MYHLSKERWHTLHVMHMQPYTSCTCKITYTSPSFDTRAHAHTCVCSTSMVQDLKVGMLEVRWIMLEPLDRDQLDPTDLPRMLQVWYHT